MLIQLHLREKQELYHAIDILKQALRKNEGRPPDLPDTVSAVDMIRSADDAIDTALVIAAQAEIERLRDEVVRVHAQHTASTDRDGGDGSNGCTECARLQEQLTMTRARFEADQEVQTGLVKIAQDERLRAEKRIEDLEERVKVAERRADDGEVHSRDGAGNGELAEQLSNAEAKILLLEKRLATAESQSAETFAYASKLEEAADERDMLLAKLTAVESRAGEARARSLSSSGLRDMLAASEARRATAEQELLLTAKLAANLEERLVQALAACDAANAETQAAEARAATASASVEAQVSARWDAVGADRARWPPIAVEEMEVVEARLHSLLSRQKAMDEQLDAAVRARATAEEALNRAENRAKAAEAAAQRTRTAVEEHERRLEAAVMASSRQADEFRLALARVERERDTMSLRLLKNDNVKGSGLSKTDVQYLKHVLLKFLTAHVEGRERDCEVLLPALGAVLRATPAEVGKLREVSHANGLSWLTNLTSIASTNST